MRQRGFTLLEVLVAFTILGLSLGVLLQTFAGGLRNTALAEEYTLATLHAESVLAAIGSDEPLQSGTRQGEIDDKYSWRATITEFVDETEETDLAATPLPVKTYHLTLEVLWPSGGEGSRAVVLDTLRMVLDTGEQ